MVNKIFQKYKQVLRFLNKNKDKQLHLLYVYIGTTFLYSITTFNISIIILSLLIVAGLGYLKQKIDQKITGIFSNGDIIANHIGWLLATIYFLVLQGIK